MEKYDWVKRLGQWHLFQNDSNVTVCGKPMLGNNYTQHIPENNREKCTNCFHIQSVVDKVAPKIDSWLQSAVGDIAFINTMDDMFLDEEWGKRLAKAKKDGVTDLPGWLADALYDDVDTLVDLLGDRIYDKSQGSNEKFNAICKELSIGAHGALKEACQTLMKARNG